MFVVTGRETNDRSAEDFLCTALSVPKCIAGTGSILSLSFEKSNDSGKTWVSAPTDHAVALYRETDSTYTFFDPNLGCYRCKNRELMFGALVLLFRYGYKEKDKRVAESSFKGSYAVFAHKKTADKDELSRDELAQFKNKVIITIDKAVKVEKAKRLNDAREALQCAGQAEKEFDELGKQLKLLDERSEKAEIVALALQNTGKTAEYSQAADIYKEALKAYNACVDTRKKADHTRVETYNKAEKIRVKADMSQDEADRIRLEAYQAFSVKAPAITSVPTTLAPSKPSLVTAPPTTKPLTLTLPTPNQGGPKPDNKVSELLKKFESK